MLMSDISHPSKKVLSSLQSKGLEPFCNQLAHRERRLLLLHTMLWRPSFFTRIYQLSCSKYFRCVSKNFVHLFSFFFRWIENFFFHGKSNSLKVVEGGSWWRAGGNEMHFQCIFKCVHWVSCCACWLCMCVKLLGPFSTIQCTFSTPTLLDFVGWYV